MQDTLFALGSELTVHQAAVSSYKPPHPSIDWSTGNSAITILSSAALQPARAEHNLHNTMSCRQHTLSLTVESHKDLPQVFPLHKADVIAAPVLLPVAVAGGTPR
jgi:hypothetical protein